MHAEEISLEWLLESATDAMIIIDRESRIIVANPTIEQLFDYQRQELTGKSMEILLPERFRQTHHFQLADYSVQPRACAMCTGMELIGLRQDGTIFPMDLAVGETRQGERRKRRGIRPIAIKSVTIRFYGGERFKIVGISNHVKISIN